MKKSEIRLRSENLHPCNNKEPSADELLTQDVLMSEQHGLVELRLTEPALLLRGEEDLDGHVLPAPLALPHLAVPPFADTPHEMDLFGNRPLHL